MFKKYSDIDNSYREKYIEMIRLHGYDDPRVEWALSEKAHGVNFSVITDGKTVRFGRREAILKEGEAFFGYEKLIPKLTSGALEMFGAAHYFGQDVTHFQIYGELIGGNYPHPDVAQMNDVSSVAKGLYYSPDLHFYGFNIRAHFINGSIEYLPQFTTRVLFEVYGGMTYAPILASGTLDEMLEYPNIYQTRIPKMFGLPPIEGNICEGNVLQPTTPLRFKNGAFVIVKNKNKKWSEIGKHKEPKEPVVLSIEAETILRAALGYVNENRFEAVVSKEAEIDYFEQSNIGKLIGLLSKDTIKDVTRDIEEYLALDKKEIKIINKQIVAAAKDLILPKFK